MEAAPPTTTVQLYRAIDRHNRSFSTRPSFRGDASVLEVDDDNDDEENGSLTTPHGTQMPHIGRGVKRGLVIDGASQAHSRRRTHPPPTCLMPPPSSNGPPQEQESGHVRSRQWESTSVSTLHGPFPNRPSSSSSPPPLLSGRSAADVVTIVDAASTVTPAPPPAPAPIREETIPTPSRPPRIPGPAGLVGRAEVTEISASLGTPGSSAGVRPGGHTDEDPHDFTRGPWVAMLRALAIPLSDTQLLAANRAGTSPHWNATIRSVLNGGYLQKVPQLLVLVRSLTVADLDFFATLRDPTAEIHACVHRSVMEEHPGLCPGCCVVLRNVSIFNPREDRHYVNIVPQNVHAVFCPGDHRSRRTTRSVPPVDALVPTDPDPAAGVFSPPHHTIVRDVSLFPGRVT